MRKAKVRKRERLQFINEKRLTKYFPPLPIYAETCTHTHKQRWKRGKKTNRDKDRDEGNIKMPYVK